jgi:hypothetical protein
VEQNPYQAPRESGYRLPAHDDAWHKWLRDRLALVVTGALFYGLVIGWALLTAWWNGQLGR